jgi:hypothetical protein
MPLTQGEKDHLRDAEIFKDEVRRALNPESEQHGLAKFLGHPVTLLVLGFVLTTAAGSWLTYYWKQRDWVNQQAYLAEQRALDKKYAVIESTFKEVALTTAAAEDVLAAFYGKNLTEEDITRRMNNWQKTAFDWRVASKVLTAKIAINFTNAKIGSTFEEIKTKRRLVGNAILNLPRPTGNTAVSASRLKEVEDAQNLVKETQGLLQTCGELMEAETRSPMVR